jgi:hypothetical protein
VATLATLATPKKSLGFLPLPPHPRHRQQWQQDAGLRFVYDAIRTGLGLAAERPDSDRAAPSLAHRGAHRGRDDAEN